MSQIPEMADFAAADALNHTPDPQAQTRFAQAIQPELRRRLALAAVDWDSEIATVRPHLFSPHCVHIAPSCQEAMAAVIQAIESVCAWPAWQDTVLAWAQPLARLPQMARSVFMGYDFHLTAAGPKLIEINTNAGGGLLAAQLVAADPQLVEVGNTAIAAYAAMFAQEWADWEQRQRRQHHLSPEQVWQLPTRTLAIVDTDPTAQYLAPEFALFQTLLSAQGWQVVITDPKNLVWNGQHLIYQSIDGNLPIGLVYNRLTDFAFSEASNAALAAAYAANAVLLTPHPYAYALLADKRNLSYLANDNFLNDLGVDAATRAILAAGIPRTVPVTPERAEQFWAERRQWFFKPACGFGSRATYRGDKLTKRVFSEILAGDYIAQEIIPPSECTVYNSNNETERLKIDVRNYVYAGEVQLLAARLYQGQTTNFRTPGGGFARVISSNEAN